jgi:hypothetical protein
MTYDIVTRLMEGNHLACGDPGSPWSVRCVKCLAADEIERLRVALALACGELSTTDHHRNQHPEPLMKQFLNEARRG